MVARYYRSFSSSIYPLIFVICCKCVFSWSFSTPTTCPAKEALKTFHRQNFDGCEIVHLWDGKNEECGPRDFSEISSPQAIEHICDGNVFSSSCHPVSYLRNIEIKTCMYYMIWGSTRWAATVIEEGLHLFIFKPSRFFVVVNNIRQSFDSFLFPSILWKVPYSVFIDVNQNSKRKFKYIGYTFDTDDSVIKLTNPLKENYIDIKPVYEKLKNFKKKSLRAALQFATPYAFGLRETPLERHEMDDIPIKSWDGIDVRVAKEIASRLNFQLKFFMPADRAWGQLINGTWTGMIGAVYRDKADMALSMITISLLRETVVDFCFPVSMGPLSFISPLPPLIPQWQTLVKPFPPLVWSLVLLSVPIVSFSFWMVSSISAKISGEGSVFQRPARSTMFCLRAICTENNARLPEDFPSRILSGVWLVTAFLINTLYSGLLFAFLTYPLHQKPILTFHEVVHEAGVPWGLRQIGGMWEELFRKSGNPDLVHIWDNMEHMKNLEACFHKVMDENFLCFDQLSTLQRYEKTKGYDKNPKVIYAKDLALLRFLSFPVQTNSPLKDIFSIWIIRLHSAGLIEKWMEEFVGGARSYSPSGVSLNMDRQVVFKIFHLQGVFWLYVIGHLLGLLFFACEKLVKRFSHY